MGYKFCRPSVAKKITQSLLLLPLIAYVFNCFGIYNLAFAQQEQELFSLGVAQHLPVKADGEIPDGSLISFRDDQYILSPEAYDKGMVGVSTSKPAVELQYLDQTNTVPVIISGKAKIRVNAQNGTIRPGDPLTGSGTPGVAMKATQTGFVVGQALQGFTASQAGGEGLIELQLDIKFSFGNDSPPSTTISTRLLQLVTTDAAQLLTQPAKTAKFLAAALVLVVSLTYGFLTFGRVARSAIDSLGRNPLAARPIVIGMFFNIVINIAIIVSGIVVAYLILRI